MNIVLLENAGVSLAKVRALEAMIADIDGIRGYGIPVGSSRNTRLCKAAGYSPRKKVKI